MCDVEKKNMQMEIVKQWRKPLHKIMLRAFLSHLSAPCRFHFAPLFLAFTKWHFHNLNTKCWIFTKSLFGFHSVWKWLWISGRYFPTRYCFRVNREREDSMKCYSWNFLIFLKAISLKSHRWDKTTQSATLFDCDGYLNGLKTPKIPSYKQLYFDSM